MLRFAGTKVLDYHSVAPTLPATMNARSGLVVLLAVGFAGFLPAAEEAPKTSMKDVLRARIAEDAKKTEAKKNSSSPAPASKEAPSAATAPTATPPDAAPAKAPTPTAKETPTVLPKVEVKKGRITELDQKLAQQELDIARERKNLKASEVDTALNDSKIAKPLAIFGGESTQFRQRVASERVELMEAEKDILEAMARAKTKEEKQELQKQLNELKAVRRELEKSLR
jgi:hypothetical protein